MQWHEVLERNILLVLSQCRVPGGAPEGGQFASCDGGQFGKWQKASDLETASENLIDMGITGQLMHSEFGDPAMDRAVLSRVNELGDHMNDVFAARPELVDFYDKYHARLDINLAFSKGERLTYANDDGVARTAAGLWSPDDATIELPVGDKRVGLPQPAVGVPPGKLRGTPMNVGRGFTDTFRHELGHGLYDSLPTKHQKGWEKLHNDLGGSNYFKRAVSVYSGTNSGEAFAESFSAWSHPGYGTSTRGGSELPAAVETYFNEVFGG